MSHFEAENNDVGSLVLTLLSFSPFPRLRNLTTHRRRRRRRKKTVSVAYAWSITVGHFVCKASIPGRVLVERHFSGGRFLDTRPMFEIVVIRFFHFSLRRVV